MSTSSTYRDVPILLLDLADFTKTTGIPKKRLVLEELQRVLTDAARFFMPHGQPWQKWHRHGTGDGYYFLFDSLDAAVAAHYALQIRVRLTEVNKSLDGDALLRARLVLAHGDVERVDDQLLSEQFVEAERLISDEQFKKYANTLDEPAALACTELFHARWRSAANQLKGRKFAAVKRIRWTKMSVTDKHGFVWPGYVEAKQWDESTAGTGGSSPPATPELCGAMLENYHAHARREWEGMWNTSDSPEQDTGNPPFIEDQGIRMLARRRIGKRYPDPRPYLRPEYFRTLRGRAGCQDDDKTVWRRLSREVLIRQLSQPGGGKDRWNRLVLATDAGVGKTTNIRWLHAFLNAPGSAALALLLDVASLPKDPGQVMRLLGDLFCRAKGNAEPVERDQVDSLLRNLRMQGRLVLLIDALDQVDAHDLACIQTLRHLLADDHWKGCTILLGSRPFALERDWLALFPDVTAQDWQFLHVEEFTPEQQRAYLGPARYDLIPDDARSVLTIPRVLYYLFISTDDDLRTIRTASDVYGLATDRLLVDGLRARGADACTPSQARLLLSAIAFEMAAGAKNFHAVEREGMDDFVRKVAEHCRTYDRDYGLDWTAGKLKQVVAMNEFLRHALLEAGCPLHVQWRNRSLQEFFAGMWLAKYVAETDVETVRDLRYIAGHPETEDYREVWKFATEMPATHRSPTAWVRSMATLYIPRGRGKAAVQRSTEMIYRSWRTMREYAAGPNPATDMARAAIERFEGEFSRFLEGRHGPRARRIARQLTDAFVAVPPTAGPLRFRMGSADTEPGRKDNERLRWAEIVRPLEMSRYLVTVEQYELFDPNHRGRRDHYRWRKRYPVIHVDWYDAWVFSRWLGQTYRLPTETEWEYACRAGTTTAYSFGDDRKQVKQHAHSGGYFNTLFRLTAVGCLKPNQWGLYDMHGNCWEWCETWYHDDSAVGEQPDYVGRFRVIRGGSCFVGRWRVRSAEREPADPRHTHPGIGFRVVRDMTVRTGTEERSANQHATHPPPREDVREASPRGIHPPARVVPKRR